MSDTSNHPDERRSAGQQKTIAGILSSALDMEDQISHGVYEEYLDRKKWPSQIDDATFEDIRRRLTVLIEDTRKHQKILKALSKDYDNRSE